MTLCIKLVSYALASSVSDFKNMWLSELNCTDWRLLLFFLSRIVLSSKSPIYQTVVTVLIWYIVILEVVLRVPQQFIHLLRVQKGRKSGVVGKYLSSLLSPSVPFLLALP